MSDSMLALEMPSFSSTMKLPVVGPWYFSIVRAIVMPTRASKEMAVVKKRIFAMDGSQSEVNGLDARRACFIVTTKRCR